MTTGGPDCESGRAQCSARSLSISRSAAKLRGLSNNFPGSIRNPDISWAAHRSSGSPEMLETIVKAVGKKPITNAVVRSMWFSPSRGSLLRLQPDLNEAADGF